MMRSSLLSLSVKNKLDKKQRFCFDRAETSYVVVFIEKIQRLI